MSTEIITQPAQDKVPISFGESGVQLATFDQAWRFAVAVSKSSFAPKGVDTPEAILIAVQFGAELGLSPMAALQSLAIINGRPSIYGDAALALVRSKGDLLEHYSQSVSGEGEAMKAIVKVKRKGEGEIAAEFSVADAKKAQLWGKAGPWSQYPARMLMWRARGFALRDAFGDVLRGLATSEEVQDMPEVIAPMKAAKVKLAPALEDRPSLAAADLPPAETAGEPAPDGGNQSVPSLETQLQALMDADKVSSDELAAVLKRFEVRIPRNFSGPMDLTDKALTETIAAWPEYLPVIKAERTP